MLTVTLPWPPTVNTYYRNLKGKTLISAKGRKYRDAVADQVLIQCAFNGQFTGYVGRLGVLIEAYPPDKRSRDLDNILKSLLDSLTKAGVWADDSQIDDLQVVRKTVGGMVRVQVWTQGATA